MYLVVATSGRGPRKFWTGRTLGRWPEYVRDRARAIRLKKGTAEQMAAAFNALRTPVHWEIEEDG